MEPRVTLITLGVVDLPTSVKFYRDGLGWPTAYQAGEGIAFFQTRGARIALYPRAELASDISPMLPAAGSGFSGITLGHNVRTKEEVGTVLAQAAAAGATVVKPAQDVFWGGHSGYFRDPDGHHWEVAWNPLAPLDADGLMQL